MNKSKNIATSKIKAANIVPKASIFLSRIDKEVTVADITEHLTSVFDENENFQIEEIAVRSGDYKRFEISSRPEIEKELLDPSNWPNDVIVKKFGFFRPTYKQRRSPTGGTANTRASYFRGRRRH